MENFGHLRRTQKDLFGLFLDQNCSLWQSSDVSASSEYRESLRNFLFSLYTGIKINLAPINGTIEWMEFAHKHDVKVGVLTNGVVVAQQNKWACLDIPYKTQVTLLAARECGREKPHPETFRRISQTLGVGLSQITFIGDRFENDLAYPLSQGSTGILLSQEAEFSQPDGSWCSAPDLASAFSLYKLKVGGTDDDC